MFKLSATWLDIQCIAPLDLLTKDASKGRKINRIITLDSGNDKKLKISDFASSKQGW